MGNGPGVSCQGWREESPGPGAYPNQVLVWEASGWEAESSDPRQGGESQDDRKEKGKSSSPALSPPLPPSGSLSWQEKLLEEVLGSWLDSCPVLTVTCWEGLTGGGEGHGCLGRSQSSGLRSQTPREPPPLTP